MRIYVFCLCCQRKMYTKFLSIYRIIPLGTTINDKAHGLRRIGIFALMREKKK